MSGERRRNIWTAAETETLINLISDEKIMRLLDGKRSRNSNIYARLVGPMLDAGYERDVPQIRTKWKHLQQDYKKELIRREKHGASPHPMPHFERLNELLGSRFYVTYEPEEVDSGETNAEDNLIDVTSFESTSNASYSPGPMQKNKIHKIDRIMEQVKEVKLERSRRLGEFQIQWQKECQQKRKVSERDSEETNDQHMIEDVVSLQTSAKSKRPSTNQDEVLEKLPKRMEQPYTSPGKVKLPHQSFGEYVAEQLRSMPQSMVPFCQKVINEAIFLGTTRRLNETSRVVTVKPVSNVS